jgi:two-component system, NtrC family, sensor kinase
MSEDNGRAKQRRVNGGRFRCFRMLYQSLSVRLLLPLLAITIVVLVGYALLTIQSTKEKWTQLMHDNAARTSELVKGATHYGMLSNSKEDVHHTIRKIAQGPGVAGIRVYDKRGQIIFSADNSEIGKKVDLKAEACVLCHESDVILHSPPQDLRVRKFKSVDGRQILGLINPIENEARCSSASCHAHPADQTILGVLDVQLSTSYMDKTLARTQGQLIWGSLLITVILSFALILFVNRLVRRPVQRLYEGTKRIASGDLEQRIAITSQDEMGRLAGAFNKMTDDLRSARAELTEWSSALEDKVVAKTEELGHMHRRTLHMDKMASLGKLAATVAHELNNPLAGILTYAKLVERGIAGEDSNKFTADEIKRYLHLVQTESTRCGKIVQNLLLFAHPSAGQMGVVHINDVVARSVMLIQHHLDINAVNLEIEPLPADDVVQADGGQIQQALLALLINAVEAMSGDGGGTLRVHCAKEGAELVIDVGDTGRGIPAEARDHIFDPFYSTKDDESGVGLGLSVVYGIVQRHQGMIDFDSEMDRGTTFHLRIPLRSAKKGRALASPDSGESVYHRRR